MMPSSRQSAWNASSASASVADLVADPAGIAQVAVLRPDAGIIQAGGDRVRRRHLAVGVLQQVAQAAVQHARACPR